MSEDVCFVKYKVAWGLKIMFVYLYLTVNGGWGIWLPWEPCQGICGIGDHVRHRRCDNPQPQYGGADCVGEEMESEPCTLAPCSGKKLYLSFLCEQCQQC